MSPSARPPRSIAQEALIALLRTADQVRRGVASVIEPHGVTLQQYNVLRILRGAGPEGLPTLDIGLRMIEQAPGITRLLDRLIRKQLVSRSRGQQDARQVICRITPKGLRLLASLDRPVLEADEAAMAGLGAAGQRQLVDLLSRLVREP